ncbi:MAG: hypothetical protein K2Y27_23920 [Xanthobacteraceae bacterium]|nr:hypothetical protein [Xanthobacteraceae bacterium]
MLLGGYGILRNVFDQYGQAENRVTHALMTAMSLDRTLLASFLRDLVKTRSPIPARKLMVLEQRYPGEDELEENELQRRGIPDGWIFDEESAWCVFIETKVTAPLRLAQVESHRRTAIRRGFRTVKPVVIDRFPSNALPSDVTVLEWRTVYAWLKRHSEDSEWAARAAEYLEIAEAKLIENQTFTEGTLTMFAGIPFGPDHPYTYLEAKRLLRLATEALRARRDLQKALGMNPAIDGRGMIKGYDADAVWDFLSLSKASNAKEFTKHPHLTLNIASRTVEAMVTIPHRVNTPVKRAIRELGEDGFQTLTRDILRNLKPLLRSQKYAAPWFRGIQRRYPAQSAPAFIDARIDFDLRTAVPNSGAPKAQPNWLSAAFASFVDK